MQVHSKLNLKPPGAKVHTADAESPGNGNPPKKVVSGYDFGGTYLRAKISEQLLQRKEY